jgi:hypothetical protein
MIKYGEITIKIKYPLKPDSYPTVAYDDFETMVGQDVAELKDGEMSIEDLMDGSEEITGRVFDPNRKFED